MRSTLNLIFIAAIDDDLCYKNPVNKNIKLQSSVSPAEKSAYTQAEYNIVWDFARSHRFGLSIMVMMETGISRSELLGITRPNIDFDNNIIYITDGLVEEKSTETDRYVLVAEGLKNKYRARPIPISGELSDALKNKPTVIYIGGNAKKVLPPWQSSLNMFFIHQQAGRTARIIGTSANIPFLWTIYKRRTRKLKD